LTPLRHYNLILFNCRYDENEECSDLKENYTGRGLSNILQNEGATIVVPLNTPQGDETNKDDSKKLSSVECRKSIDKIYDLIKKLGKMETLDSKSSRSRKLDYPM
jgi:glycine cleavage system H lipoate-binding protein